MSRQIALDNVTLKDAPRWGHTDYSLEYHSDYLAACTGLSTDSPDLMHAAYRRFGFDFLWSTVEGLVDWARAGRVTDMGHAAYARDGSDQRSPAVCPFKTEAEVWEFDAVAEYGQPDFDTQVAAYEGWYQATSSANPDQLVTGGRYHTIVSGAIAAFGWENLLLAAAQPAKMERVFDSFYRYSLFHMQAWAKTRAEVIIQHDDFVWTSGPFMRPAFYREVIIPRYAELWKPLHAAGKKVLFCSDGNFMPFAEDIVNAGADGLIFEPVNDFGFMADHFGQTSCLVGSYVDCRDLTFSRWEQARQDIDSTLTALERCKGAILAVGNHLPPNIPAEMLDNYFDYLLPRLTRSDRL